MFSNLSFKLGFKTLPPHLSTYDRGGGMQAKLANLALNYVYSLGKAYGKKLL